MRFFTVCVTIVFCLGGAFNGVIAQGKTEAKEFKIKKVDIASPTPPTSGGGKQRPSSMGRNWIEIEVEYEAKPIREAGNMKTYTDEVEIRYTIGIVDPEKAKGGSKSNLENYALLEGNVTHLMVYDGPDHYSVMYVHPNVVKRYGGDQAFRSKQSSFTFVELLVGGEVKDSYCNDPSMVRDTTWREKMSAVSGLLLNKDHSPWAPYYWETYEMLKR